MYDVLVWFIKIKKWVCNVCFSQSTSRRSEQKQLSHSYEAWSVILEDISKRPNDNMRRKYQHTLEKINTNLKWKQSSFEVGEGQSLDLLSLYAMKYGVSKIICPNLSSELQTVFIIVQGNNISQLPSKHISDKYLLRLIWYGTVLNRREMWSREGPTSWKSAVEYWLLLRHEPSLLA